MVLRETLDPLAPRCVFLFFVTAEKKHDFDIYSSLKSAKQDAEGVYVKGSGVRDGLKQY